MLDYGESPHLVLRLMRISSENVHGGFFLISPRYSVYFVLIGRFPTHHDTEQNPAVNSIPASIV